MLSHCQNVPYRVSAYCDASPPPFARGVRERADGMRSEFEDASARRELIG